VRLGADLTAVRHQARRVIAEKRDRKELIEAQSPRFGETQEIDSTGMTQRPAARNWIFDEYFTRRAGAALSR
jgi:hypothetical protein